MLGSRCPLPPSQKRVCRPVGAAATCAGGQGHVCENAHGSPAHDLGSEARILPWHWQCLRAHKASPRTGHWQPSLNSCHPLNPSKPGLEKSPALAASFLPHALHCPATGCSVELQREGPGKQQWWSAMRRPGASMQEGVGRRRRRCRPGAQDGTSCGAAFARWPNTAAAATWPQLQHTPIQTPDPGTQQPAGHPSCSRLTSSRRSCAWPT